jgi:hypothetical protein
MKDTAYNEVFAARAIENDVLSVHELASPTLIDSSHTWISRKNFEHRI